MVTFSYSLLNRYGNHWKYFDDNRYLPPYFETDPSKDTPTHNIEVAVQAHHRTALDGRCNPLFEAVQFTLHCAIKTQVGKHAASQKILQCSERRRWSDFASYPDDHNRDKGSPDSTCCVTVAFNTSGVRLPSSEIFTGSRYITEHTALRDQRLVTGKCKVKYWITAELIPNISTENVLNVPQITSCPLDLSFQPSAIDVSPVTATAKQSTRLRFSGSCNSVFAYCGYSRFTSRQPADICFNVSRMPAIPLTCRGTNGQHEFTLPITMSITISPPRSAVDATRSTLLRHQLHQKGLESMVSLTAHWHTLQHFSAGAAATDHTITSDLSNLVAKDMKLGFPPFYVSKKQHGDEYTATTYIDIAVPEALVSNCSFDSKLLEISHSLNLTLSTGKLEATVPLLPAYTAKMQVDCALS
ncbi:hypothetical protein LTR70_009543 [Exophiala xenobiotica]|uniref:Arrestin-like N-terminal domain-containing protein n=1 Tax=Lithohypha guttulata TaxID=1690604 RepID=A0ABR0JWY9_9EURO|nr:hypothetical protein LTR24_009438 [Lithohypha guttulata]KAK5310352.1 hypothetical protein LTR70_009543 [Exophiala xenobiotica]